MRRSAAVLVPVLLLAASALAAWPAAAVEEVESVRVGGATRLETAAEAARAAFPDGAEYAVIATSVAFPDALVGSPLAGNRGGPVLLNPPAELADTTREVLDDLGVTRVTLLGSSASLSEQGVAEPLRQMGLTVDRIGGSTLYETAANVARTAAEAFGGLPTMEGSTTVFLAGTDNVTTHFPDALAASAPAFAHGFPLLLTARGELSDEAEAALADLAPQRVVIFGGTAAVAPAVETELDAAGYEIDRLGGANRMATAAVVAERFIGLGFFDGTTALVARGDAFPDALTAGALAGQLGGPIVLAAAPEILSRETAGWLASRCATLARLRIIGGTSAVSDPVAQAAEVEAERCDSGGGGGGDPAPQTYRVEPEEPRRGTPGQALDLVVSGRYDGAVLEGPLELGLFPCRNADVLGTGPATFVDADGDGAADGLGSTDTGSAAIAVLDGDDIADTRVVHDVEPDADGDVDVRLASSAEDCAVLVVWDDADGNAELAVGDGDQPAEPYGVGLAEWVTT